MPSKSVQKAKRVARKGALSRPDTENPSSNARSWNSLDPPLLPWILDAVSSMGFEKMTPVQASTIPLFVGNKDVVVEAVTGSGKTLAFLIPVAERLLRAQEMPRNGHVAAVIVSPTRELATQIYSVLLSLLAFHGPSAAELSPADGESEKPACPPSSMRIRPLLLFGGNISPAQDLKTFLEQSPTVLVGTPGRLNELLASQHVHCSNDSFDTLVLDEADRLLDLGFKETLTKIMSRLPKQRRTGLFSASISDAVVGGLVRAGLRNPVKVVVKVQSQKEEKRTPVSLEMAYLLATPAQKLVYLQRILSPAAASALPSSSLPQKTIIYVSNCASVDYFTSLFAAILLGSQAKAGGYSIVPLHGRQSPNLRQKNFSAFTASTTPSVLLTTDLAARGLDIPEVDLVIQMDAPTDPKVFLHRCGRAGRAGRRGLAVLFLSKGREEGYIDFLEVRKTPVTQLSLPNGLNDEPSREEVEAVVGKMRAVILRDRALHDKGMKAYVSHVRAHSKHQTTSIFRVQDLDWKDLAESFALLKMPRMPELRKGIAEIDLGVDIDMTTYAYKDKAKEKARLEALTNPESQQRFTKEAAKEQKKKNLPWSEKVEEKESKEARRSKKRKRREAEKQAKMSTEEKAKEEEWKDLVEEVKRRRKEKGAEEKEIFDGFD